MQTPRMLDDITVESKKIKKSSNVRESAFLFTVEAAIDSIDGEKPDKVMKEMIIKEMHMADVNYILAAINKANDSFGLDLMLDCTCDFCALDYQSPFRTSHDFFRPTVEF